MKNKIAGLTFLLISVCSFAQKPTFEIKYSEQLAVFVFIQNLSENYPDNVFKTEFVKSRYNTQQFKDLISNFDKLPIDFSYEFDGFPYGSKIPMQTRDILKKNLIETENLKDFTLRSVGILTNKTLKELTGILSQFTPIYNELIYNPNKQAFENKVRDMIQYANENRIEEYFETGLVFYNSSWDNAIPFKIAFYPLPNSEGFTAQAFYNDFISAVQVDLEDYKGLFSVMLHEIYHILYNEQSLEVKTELDKNFKENPSKSANYAYQLLNEALATALANGFVYEKLDGKVDPEDWYNRKYINLMAKQVYPLVTDYVSKKKPIDKNFVDAYISAYETHFPNWTNELDNIMTYRYVISENAADFDIIDRKYRYRSTADYETEITDAGTAKMKTTTLTKVIIISKSSKEKLNLVKRAFNELKNWKYNPEQEFAYHTLLNDGSRLIVMNQKDSDLEAMFKKLEAQMK
ncbi:MAG: hypothetical protein CFE23_08380 [Flavobacterium sp. BFFFF1]|uniref:hypothetical protein n=1 Tax=Flavobacterium sp. BFFFF1 TaxID=2015557 RepID=UPI000BDC682E|nr:hypothetical protein [Flavobacterium sp. BFFFF1]OYU80741.1 MAG: hypothetical protein CFE23_08380 [Flavobacterium sp. BFFFF1]